MSPHADFDFHGRLFTALPDGALYWAQRRALILADLHFEKGSWFAERGQMLPPYDSAATLSAIERLVRLYDPLEIWCLGDSFHDDAGPLRLDAAVIARLIALAVGRRWMWITGNHDPAPGALAMGEAAPEVWIEGLVLRHEAMAHEAAPELSGHFHPKWRVNIRGRSISRRCFVRGGNRLILPAFGAFTGGLDARSDVILTLVGPAGEAIVPLNERLLNFSLLDRRNVAR
jgi:hypothetical protein